MSSTTPTRSTARRSLLALAVAGITLVPAACSSDEPVDNYDGVDNDGERQGDDVFQAPGTDLPQAPDADLPDDPEVDDPTTN